MSAPAKAARTVEKLDMAVDITNAGGLYQEARAVRDGDLITAVYFGYLPEQFRLLMAALLEAPPDSTVREVIA